MRDLTAFLLRDNEDGDEDCYWNQNTFHAIINFLQPCYPQCGLRINSTGITWELVGNAEPEVHSRPIELDLHFNKIPSDSQTP